MLKSPETEGTEGKLGVTALASISEQSGCFHYGLTDITTISLMWRYIEVIDTCQIGHYRGSSVVAANFSGLLCCGIPQGSILSPFFILYLY